MGKSLSYLAFFSEFFVFVENKANDITENDDFPLGKAKLKELLFGQQWLVAKNIPQDLYFERVSHENADTTKAVIE